MSAGALPPEFIFGSRRSSLIGCFSALCLHVSPFGALFWSFVLSSLLGFVRDVCINMNEKPSRSTLLDGHKTIAGGRRRSRSQPTRPQHTWPQPARPPSTHTTHARPAPALSASAPLATTTTLLTASTAEPSIPTISTARAAACNPPWSGDCGSHPPLLLLHLYLCLHQTRLSWQHLSAS